MRFVNYSPDATVQAIETTKVGGEELLFVHVAAAADTAKIEALLTSAQMEQVLLSNTADAEGGRLLVCRGKDCTRALLTALKEQGEELTRPPSGERGFDPWLWRGLTSIAGQSLQITSGFLGKGTPADRYSLIGFGTLNLMANFTNIIFGAQEKHDPHQLKLLKEQVNASVKSHDDGQELPSVNASALDKRIPPERTVGQRTYDFLQQYSVSFGEIGLRTLGATQLSFPFTNYRKAAQTLRQTGSFSQTLKVAKNTNPVTYAAGLLTLLGKFTSMAATEPDPYNTDPKANTPITQFRERFAFPLSSILEGVGAAYMTHDRFTRQKITLNGKTMPDYFGGTGNAIFVGGYGIRMAAPYGTREVNMPELYAHVSDCIAKLEESAQAPALAEIAVQLKNHFHDKTFTTAEIYTAILNDLSKTHGAVLKPAEPASKEAGEVEDEAGHQVQAPVQHEVMAQQAGLAPA